MTPKERALIALRDCGIIRAHIGRPGFAELVTSGHATAKRAGHKADYRLTQRGHGLLKLAGLL